MLSDIGEKHLQRCYIIDINYLKSKSFLRDVPKLQLAVRDIYVFMPILSSNNNKGVKINQSRVAGRAV
jgi:hypothetical protein